jgi:hypothetical protein
VARVSFSKWLRALVCFTVLPANSFRLGPQLKHCLPGWWLNRLCGWTLTCHRRCQTSNGWWIPVGFSNLTTIDIMPRGQTQLHIEYDFLIIPSSTSMLKTQSVQRKWGCL